MKKPPLLVDLIKPNYCVSFLKWEGSPYIQATKHSVHTAETMPILESIYNKLMQRVLPLCDFWDLKKVALAKNCIRQIDCSNEIDRT